MPVGVFNHLTHEQRTCTFLNNGVDIKQLFSNVEAKCIFIYLFILFAAAVSSLPA